MGTKNDGNWKSRLVSFDFEVTAFDWLLCVKERETGIWHDFHNDPQGVEEFLEDSNFIWVGYNNKHYDNYILKGVLNHYTPDDIKKINDYIIVEHGNGWEYEFDDKWVKLPPTSDLMLDMPLGQSLKEIEGNLLMDIQESTIDFNIDHKWNKEEFDEMLFYCHHDVDATERLIDERMGYLDSKVSLGTLCDLSIEESLYRTNAQLAAKSLGAVKQEHNDYHNYVIPPEVKQDLIPRSILEFIDKFKSVNETEIKETNESLKWVGDIVGTEHTIGLGGIHAAKNNYFEESNDKRIIVDFDVNSYYPSLMIEYDYLSRNVKDKSLYENYYHNRIAAKMRGDKKTANGLKLVLNTTYGASLQKFNDLYDPLMGVSTCLTGQLLLTQLLVTLDRELKTFVHIQSNTDGIMFSVDRDELDEARVIINQWTKDTRLGMGEIQIKRVIQKDVNNYIIESFDGDITVKGGYVKDFEPGFSHNSLSIVATALVNYFKDGTEPEETINNCNDPFKFQIIGKTGSTYNLGCVHYVNGKEIKVQKVNRIYATKDTSYGNLKKVKKQYLTLDDKGRYYINKKGKATYKKKWETDEGGDYFITKATIQNCPDNAIIDNSCQISIDTIDKSWYIKLAKKRINDFLGIKETKGGKKKMATTKQIDPRVALYKKIFDLGTYLSKQKYIADGYNSGQDYEYVKSSYYREILGKGCREVGLVFKFTIANRVCTPLEANKKMMITSILGAMSLIDIDTGEHEDYPIIADGTDNMDKGIYKAETMAIKYFVKNNFMLPETQDDVDTEDVKGGKEVKKEEPKKVQTPMDVKREVAKETVVADNNATVDYVKEMIELLTSIREKGATDKKGNPYGTKTLAKLQKVIDGNAAITKTDAIKLMNKLEEKLDEMEE